MSLFYKFRKFNKIFFYIFLSLQATFNQKTTNQQFSVKLEKHAEILNNLTDSIMKPRSIVGMLTVMKWLY